MRILIWCVVMVFSVFIVPSPTVWSKDNETSAQQKLVGTQKVDAGAWRGSQLMGINVYSAEGIRVGTIADIVGDVKGQVMYLILSHGGVLGIGDKLVPLPWQLVEPGEQGRTLKVQLNKEDLEKAPSFDSKKWPDFTRADWKAKAEKYYEAFRSKKKNKTK